MRLYHSRFTDQIQSEAGNRPARLLWSQLGSLLLLLLLLGCTTPAQSTPAQIHVNLSADGRDLPLVLPPGSTVQAALSAAGLALNPLDRTEPPAFTILADGAQVRLIRVTEEFQVEQVPIPFDHQTLRNESLPQDQEIYLQKGKNGLEEITYRHVFEDGKETSGAAVVKRVVLEKPVPEIIMIGIQTPFVPVAVPGKLIYLRDGNAWMIESSTGNRRAVVTTGDLDGRVLSLSDDGNWLLFTRRADGEDQINSLWALDLTSENAKLIDLTASNIVHFADWIPGSDSKVVFSTVEPRATAPGWQANNDLYALSFSNSGWVTRWKDKPVLEPNSGGVYGWWGTSFTWGPDGQTLAFARPDGIGLFDFANGEQTTSLDIIPLQTRGDWAWVPGIAWGADGKVLYTVDHVPPLGSLAPEESQNFDLTAIPLQGGSPVHLVSQAGMFAYPLVSPLQNRASGEQAYQVAFLQAIFPTQSETSRYRVMVMDRDGSNRQILFPSEDRSGGLTPQKDWGAWSPAALQESGHLAIAVIFEGNLWLVDSSTGQAQQITGDGLTTRVIWK